MQQQGPPGSNGRGRRDPQPRRHADPAAPAAPAPVQQQQQQQQRAPQQQQQQLQQQQQQPGQQQQRPPGAGGRGRRQMPAAEQGAAPAAAAAAAAPVAPVAREPAVEAGADGVSSFEQLGLLPPLVAAVRECGYTKPTPIQQRAIPHALAGRDVLAGAQTGTGKTAAFALPILHQLFLSGQPVHTMRVLVLTPTRELAAQVGESFSDYGKHLPRFSTAVIFGGVGQGPQVEALRARPTVLVATPGRLIDLQGQGKVDFSHITHLVLDEADRMLDMGFFPDVSRILKMLPAQKQTLFFSATFNADIRRLAGGLLKSPAEVQVTPANSTVDRIHQSYCLVGRDRKTPALVHIIKTSRWNQVLIFCRTKAGANQVAKVLNASGVTAMALHGNKSQTARTQALGDFKSGALQALVATDIAARGLDIEELPHVINYELPNVPEDYVHRIGRTGRAGKDGYAVSLVSLDEEGFMRNIISFARREIPRDTTLPAEYGVPAGEKAEPIAMGRQTLWGGLGPVPSRDVMAAAGKAARREMNDRIQERKKQEGGRRGGAAGGRGGGGGRGGATAIYDDSDESEDEMPPMRRERPPQQQQQRAPQQQQQQQQRAPQQQQQQQRAPQQQQPQQQQQQRAPQQQQQQQQGGRGGGGRGGGGDGGRGAGRGGGRGGGGRGGGRGGRGAEPAKAYGFGSKY